LPQHQYAVRHLGCDADIVLLLTSLVHEFCDL
jgi:hypothetical protein